MTLLIISIDIFLYFCMYILTWLNFTFLEAETLRLYLFIMDCCVLISYQCISMYINVYQSYGTEKCAGAEVRNGVWHC